MICEQDCPDLVDMDDTGLIEGKPLDQVCVDSRKKNSNVYSQWQELYTLANGAHGRCTLHHAQRGGGRTLVISPS